jgi:glycosyltransferase involved in cell wall biosynthesis
MKCGVPVIVGNRTSLPEVVGEAALLVDPFDVDGITASLARMINDSALRSSLRAAGLERAKLFDWRETARQTLAVYERAVVQPR